MRGRHWHCRVFRLPHVLCHSSLPASAHPPSRLRRYGETRSFSVAASLFYFALLHKKVGLANLKACQAEVFSPKKRRLEHSGLEPLTPSMPLKCSTSWANTPLFDEVSGEDGQSIHSFSRFGKQKKVKMFHFFVCGGAVMVLNSYGSVKNRVGSRFFILLLSMVYKLFGKIFIWKMFFCVDKGGIKI